MKSVAARYTCDERRSDERRSEPWVRRLSAAQWGGAVASQGDAEVRMYNCSVRGSRAQWGGCFSAFHHDPEPVSVVPAAGAAPTDGWAVLSQPGASVPHLW